MQAYSYFILLYLHSDIVSVTIHNPQPYSKFTVMTILPFNFLAQIKLYQKKRVLLLNE